MTDNATEYLKRLTQQMTTDEENFENAMKREPVANKQAPPTPAPARVQVRKSTPEDDADRAAAALANYND